MLQEVLYTTQAVMFRNAFQQGFPGDLRATPGRTKWGTGGDSRVFSWFDYINLINTISGFVSIRMGGPQVPAPLEV